MAVFHDLQCDRNRVDVRKKMLKPLRSEVDQARPRFAVASQCRFDLFRGDSADVALRLSDDDVGPQLTKEVRIDLEN